MGPRGPILEPARIGLDRLAPGRGTCGRGPATKCTAWFACDRQTRKGICEVLPAFRRHIDTTCERFWIEWRFTEIAL